MVLYAGIFFVRLASNSAPIFGLTQGQKFSNSTHFDVTQKSATVRRFFFLDFEEDKLANLGFFSQKNCYGHLKTH